MSTTIPAAFTSFAVGVLLLGAGCSNQPGAQDDSTDAPVIEPKNAVGKVKAGMNISQVLAELGDPQRKTANALEYTRQGFAVMPGGDGTVQVVMCGDVTGIRGPLVRAFKGRTKEGIGMLSTREEIVSAYGEASKAERMPGGQESLRYDSLGITFTLEAGKVHHMIVRLPDTEEPGPATVTLEPATK